MSPVFIVDISIADAYATACFGHFSSWVHIYRKLLAIKSWFSCFVQQYIMYITGSCGRYIFGVLPESRDGKYHYRLRIHSGLVRYQGVLALSICYIDMSYIFGYHDGQHILYPIIRFLNALRL